MPTPLPTAEILTVCDAVAGAIQAAAAVYGEAVTVERVYLGPVTLKNVSGCKVFVFPGKYANSPVNRAEDGWEYAVTVVICQRYEPQGEPPTAWLDTRVNFVQTCVNDALDFSRDPLTFATTRELWTASAEVVVYDDARLDEEKLFWSQVAFGFTENKGA